MSRNLRDKLQALLGVRCVFPNSTTLSAEHTTARCMLEVQSGEKAISFEDSTEDIVVRLKVLSTNEADREIKYLLSKLYSKVESIRYEESSTVMPLYLEHRRFSSSLHPGIANVMKIVESKGEILVVQSFAKHSLLSVSRFHTDTTLSSATLGNIAGLGSKDLRLRFIIFQLLQAVGFVHSQGLCLDKIVPSNVMLDDDMWLYLPIGLSERVSKIVSINVNKDIRLEDTFFIEDEDNNNPENESFIPRPIDYYEPLTIQWVSGKLSNFEYLMAINYGAGRTMMDPLYHPIIPWVTDFTCYPVQLGVGGGLRDLTRTKFRLSKGDAQLETTYRHSDPPHHVPESLSELTYYIYMARRTPMQVLRRVVRDVFVPEHYPHSIGRIYDWTPDESIPEFYFDTSVFKSIHTKFGLQDLELPSYAPTPEEFIKYHRSVLESDEVSCQLHHWIDLTFGYCLEGEPAVENMNVPLRHTLSSTEKIGVDSPHVNKNPGFVVLFDVPHPVKQVQNLRAKSHIFSFNNTKASTSSFLDVNQLYMLNNSNKFSNTAVDSQHRDLFNIDALINLDSASLQQVQATMFQIPSQTSNPKVTNNEQTPMPMINTLSTAKEPSANRVNRGGSVSETVMNGDESKYASAPKRGSVRRASLLKPHADPSLSKLKHAGFISMRHDYRCINASANLENQKKEYIFAIDYGTSLDASYALPQISTEDSEKKKTKKSNIDSGCWDDEFEVNMKAVQMCLVEAQGNNEDTDSRNLTTTTPMLTRKKTLTPAEKNRLHIRKEQADDMLAIGCIIAELFNGRPLMNRNDSKLIANNTEECIKFVFRNTTTLPLGFRRLITLLLQPDHIARPKAVEILQACLLQDQEIWTPRDVSRQRSGGADAGFVNFQNINYLNKSSTSPATNAQENEKIIEELQEDGITITRLQQAFINSIEQEEEPNFALFNNARVELLSDFCNGLFPQYFKTVYRIVGELKLCKDGLKRICILLNNLDDLVNISLDGLNLALSHLLEIVGDPSPFRSDGEQNNSGQNTPTVTSSKSHQLNKENQSKRANYRAQIIVEYPRIIDVLGQRLGIDGTEKLVVPKVIDFLNNLQSPELLQCLLHSSLWNIIILRAGVRSFLRYFLHFLLTYISSGTLYNVSKGVDKSNLDAAPLWATVETERNEWLHACPLTALRQVQRSSVFAIASLIEPEAMGPGLCARYLLPALLSLIGIPQLAVAGFGSTEPIGYSYEDVCRIFTSHMSSLDLTPRVPLEKGDRPTLNDLNSGIESKSIGISQEEREILENYVFIKSSYDSQYMFVSQAIVNLCPQLGELVVSELILSKIFNSTIAEMEHSLLPIPKNNTICALMEVILLLNGILPSLSPETVQKDYLQPSKISGMCLPKLLTILPFAPSWSLSDDFTDDHMKYAELDQYIEGQKRYALYLELCRLIVSSSMIAGAEACTEYVLPSVDIFFKNFVNAFGMVPIESKTMFKAFELGAELFLPLAQLTGPEAFYTVVPNLNPRLEMWLVSVGSNIPAKSPPLPPNIWPEITTETVNQPEKKKGFMQWMTGKSKFLSSLSSSSSQAVTATTGTTTNIASKTHHSHSTVHPTYSYVSKSNTFGASSSNSSSNHYHTVNTTSVATTEERNSNSTITTKATNQEYEQAFESAVKKDRQQQQQYYQNTETNLQNEPAENLLSPYAAVNSNYSQLLKRTTAKDGIFKSPTEGTELMEMDPNATNPISQLRAGNVVLTTLKNNAHPPHTTNGQTNANHNHNRNSPYQHVHSMPGLDPTSPSPAANLFPDETSTVIKDGIASNNDDDVIANNEDSLILDNIRQINRNNSDSDDEEETDYSYYDAFSPADVNNENSEQSPIPNNSNIIDSSQMLVNSLENSGSTPREHNLVVDPPPFDTESDYVPIPLKAVTQPFKSYKRLISSRKNTGRNSQSNAKPRPSKKSSKVGSLLSSMHMNENENPEEIERRELYHNEMAWLLAGNGRWNIDKELKDKVANQHSKLMKGYGSGKSGSDWNPAAHISLTAPRIAVDVAADAGSLFALSMQSNTQWKLEETPGMIKCMAVNAIESLLMTCSRTGVRLWSLSSHPLLHVSSYTNHNQPPFKAGFLRSGIHAATCDGTIHLWDIESRKTLSYLSSPQERGSFLSMSIIPPRYGVVPSMGSFGDDQLLTTAGNVVSYYDVRCNCARGLNNISDWIIPPLPIAQSNFISTTSEPIQITSAASHEQYVFAGANNGGMWVMDRRMGKVLHCWQAHDGPILKMHMLSEKHVLAVSDRTAAVWEYVHNGAENITNNVNINDYARDTVLTTAKDKEKEFPSWGTGEIRKALSVKNMPDNIMTPSTMMISSFDNSPSSNSSLGMSALRGGSMQDKGIGLPSKPQFVLYCISGHKMYAGRLPSYDISARDNLHVGGANRESGELDELKLSQTYFADRKGTKLSKSKLQVTSAVLLPLRRLLLIGTEDGLVRIVS